MHKAIFTFFLVLFLGACGGGGGSHDHDTENTTRYANGIWQGTVYAEGESNHDIMLLVLDGAVAGISYAGSSLYSGYLLGAYDFLTGEFVRFDSSGEPFDDMALEGVFHAQDTVDLTYHSGLDAGSIELDFDSLSYAPAGLHVIAGHYQDVSGDLDLLISPSGHIDGSDLQGCLYDGYVQVAPDGLNIYEMLITRSACAEEAEIFALATHYGDGVVDVFVRDSNEHMQLWEIDEDGS